MRAWLLQRYEQVRRAGLPPGVETFPPVPQRYFSNISGFEPAEFVRRLIGPTENSVLVAGVGAGRDTHWLRLHGHRVTSIDLAHQTGIPDLAIADIAALPFPAASFDAVVLADVLEHTFDDRQALLEFHRVLRPDGALVANVPFGDDIGEEHVRVYSERTLHRLLRSAGFTVERTVYRGLMPLVEQGLPGFRTAFHALNLAAAVLVRRPLYLPMLTRMLEFDWRRGGHAGMHRFSRVHGAYVRALRSNSLLDYRELNRASYTDQAGAIGRSFTERSANHR